jgi:putative SOS response-associated peptidase YedK
MSRDICRPVQHHHDRYCGHRLVLAVRTVLAGSTAASLHSEPLPGRSRAPLRRVSPPQALPTLSATILVGEPNALVAPVHDRMPVMLMSEDYDRWLNETAAVDELRALLKPHDPALMKANEVSGVVNSVKNDTEECVQPLRHHGASAAKHP